MDCYWPRRAPPTLASTRRVREADQPGCPPRWCGSEIAKRQGPTREAEAVRARLGGLFPRSTHRRSDRVETGATACANTAGSSGRFFCASVQSPFVTRCEYLILEVLWRPRSHTSWAVRGRGLGVGGWRSGGSICCWVHVESRGVIMARDTTAGAQLTTRNMVSDTDEVAACRSTYQACVPCATSVLVRSATGNHVLQPSAL